MEHFRQFIADDEAVGVVELILILVDNYVSLSNYL